ncbi:MAG: hypothetical protein HC866_02810 [Leptolyngbyaceae cyanobacterium RU_5_1]|nr:hypothetical protein [Leptolyngbyaceae cyanobacterium RU_5_1]
MSQRLFSILSMGAIALGSILPTSSAHAAPRTAQDDTLQIVMIDQTQLSASQRSAFQRYLQTASLPPTKIGKRCQYYGKPQVWCLILDPAVAEKVYQQLSSQSFGSLAEMKPVRRLRGGERS